MWCNSLYRSKINQLLFSGFFLLLVLFFISCHHREVNNGTALPDTSTTVLSKTSDSLPKPTGYVNDKEHLFSQEQQQYLEKLISDFEQKTSIEIALITIDSTMTTADSLEAYTLRLARAWGVGKKDKNNGMLIGISKAYREMRIQNGLGMEKLVSNGDTRQIIDTAFIPSFKKGDYYGGTLSGLTTLMKFLETKLR
jgi:uncharacterized protein